MNSEALVLQKNLHKLCSTLDPIIIATALFAKELIVDRAWEDARKESKCSNYDRCLKLLETLMRNVKIRPDIFEEFCKILEEEAVTNNLARELKEELKKQDGRDINGQTEERESPKAKRILRFNSDPITDKILMDVAQEVGCKWEEVGVSLGLDYNILCNVVGSKVGALDNMKAFYMLQEWKRRTEEFSFRALADGLEESGLNLSAKKFCYKTT